jgi:2,4-dienoyl-CoA reductase-like NADH-dependent reductase (Old Yellow Enzyme family)
MPVSASPIPFDADWVTPQELDRDAIETIVASFSDATQRAQAAGFDAVEIHGAHGYLIHEFLSPLSNQRRDHYGGSLNNRMRLLLRVVDAVRAAWPEEKPLLVRLSCTDWVDGGLTVDDILRVAQALKDHHVDLIDCSTGGNAAHQTIPLGPGYQVAFAAQIRREIGIATGAVGLISTPELANEIIHNERADVVILGRELLRDPHWALHAARHMGVDVAWPTPYLRAKK